MLKAAALLSLTVVVLLYVTDKICAFSLTTSVVDLPKQGKITGRVKMVEGHRVDVYLGVLYSAEPERFMPPTNPPAWETEIIVNADEMKPVCPQLLPDLGDRSKIPSKRKLSIEQMLPYLTSEGENCLSLNIYAPHERVRHELYPVIVFIHGESLEWNSGNLYDGSVIAAHGKVIFITVNFRLGIYGFLKTDFSGKPSNFGLLDQIAALEWVRSNIEHFHGDANKITLMGHDSGAACVHFLMLSPMAKGLFHRAILMSGSAYSNLVTKPSQVRYSLAHELGCRAINDIKSCLEQKTDEEIKIAAKKVRLFPPFKEHFNPTADGIVISDSSLDEQMKLSDGLFAKYDLMAGVTDAVESYYLLEDKYKYDMQIDDARNILKLYIEAQYNKYTDSDLTQIIGKYVTESDVRPGLLNALSDALITAPLMKTVGYHSDHGNNSYFYVFGRPGGTSNSILGDELSYILGIPLTGAKYNKYEADLSTIMRKYWTNFAKTGNPNKPEAGIFWPPFTRNKRSTLSIGSMLYPDVEIGYWKGNEQFWNSILSEPIVEEDNVPILTVKDDSTEYANVSVTTTVDLVTTELPTTYTINEANPVIEDSVAMLITIACVCFLVANLCVFVYMYRRRGKSSCLNECSIISNPRRVGNINGCYTKSFDGSEQQQQQQPHQQHQPSSGKKMDAVKMEENRSAAIKLASIKPEAMVGKRTKRWPLSRQCSASTISMDPHTKVKEWIAQEIVYKCSPRHLRRKKENEHQQAQVAASKRTGEARTADSKSSDSRKQKISVAVDATASARTASVLKQIPIELTKSLDDGKNGTGLGLIKSSGSLAVIPRKPTLERSHAFSSEEYDHFASSSSASSVTGQNKSGSSKKGALHKSSATIRLQTPAYVREQMNINHVHSASDPCPITAAPDHEEPIYSQVDKTKKKKHLQSFSSGSNKDPSTTADSVDSTGHYEDINVTSCLDDEFPFHSGSRDAPPFQNIQRRNYPKVLPDILNDEDGASSKKSDFHNKRMSLPSSVSDYSFIPTKIPPVPPPRLTSTLGKKWTNENVAAKQQLSTVLQLKETVLASDQNRTDVSSPLSGPSGIEPPRIIIKPTATGIVGKAPKAATSQIPRVVVQPGTGHQTASRPNKKSVTTSTTGIPKLKVACNDENSSR